MLIDKSIYMFEKSVSFFHIIGSINVYYSVNSIVYFICSINTNGLQQSEKRQRLIEWSKQQQGNIFLIQETHFSQNNF
jgi:hypothetical protein